MPSKMNVLLPQSTPRSQNTSLSSKLGLNIIGIIERFILLIGAVPQRYILQELDEQMIQVQKYCLTKRSSDTNSKAIHRLRMEGLHLLQEMVSRIDTDVIHINHVNVLLWCSISCIHHFYLRVNYLDNVFTKWKTRQLWEASMKVYDKIIKMFMPDLSQSVMNSVIAYFAESKMWKLESLCVVLLYKITKEKDANEKCVGYLLSIAEHRAVTDLKNAQLVLRALYGILQKYVWKDIHSALLLRILDMFKRSIIPQPDDKCSYVPLRRGLEVCLRRVLENIPNMHLLIAIRTMVRWIYSENLTNEDLLEFGNLVEYAALLHKTNLFKDSLTADIFPLILNLVASPNRLHSLLGNRILQHLIDRHDNRFVFDTPKLFLEDSSFNINLSAYNSQDKSFIKNYREMIHDTLLAAILQHGVHKLNLESVYTSIALFLTEVPCGFTAAAVVCLMMCIQESTMSDESIALSTSHRLHATVISIMTLICWIHKAKIFYEYVTTIIERRAQIAPFLNPPIKNVYKYAQHHILWNKSELFLEDWEARYGLWKCFRSKRVKLVD